MNGLEEEQMAPKTFIYGCSLEAGKDVVFNPEDDEFEHQLDLRMACVDPSAKDELHLVEVEGQDSEGQKVKAVLVSLKPSTLPSVCLGGFTITPPAVFRLKAGSGPIHISGQHLVMMEPDQSFDEDDDVEEEEEDLEITPNPKKRPASSADAKIQKKMKMDIEEDEDDEDDEEESEEGSPIKCLAKIEEEQCSFRPCCKKKPTNAAFRNCGQDGAKEDPNAKATPAKPAPAKQTPAKKTPAKQTPAKSTPSKPKAPAQNGKSPKPSTPASKEAKTPKNKAERTPKSPQTPKPSLTVPEIKAKIMEALNKGVALPKVQAKFENFVKHSYRISETKAISELWKWRQTVKEAK